MKEILIQHLQHYTNEDLSKKTLKELLDMYNEKFNTELYYAQLKPKDDKFRWE